MEGDSGDDLATFCNTAALAEEGPLIEDGSETGGQITCCESEDCWT